MAEPTLARRTSLWWLHVRFGVLSLYVPIDRRQDSVVDHPVGSQVETVAFQHMRMLLGTAVVGHTRRTFEGEHQDADPRSSHPAGAGEVRGRRPGGGRPGPR